MSLALRLALPLLLLGLTRPACLVTVSAEKKSNRRGRIVEGLTIVEREREQLLNSIPCVVGFLQKYTHNAAWTSLTVLDDGEAARDFGHALATSLHDRFAFYRRAVDSPGERTLQPASNAIILMPNGSSLDDGYRIFDPCDRGCPFVTVLTTAFDDERRFLEEADTVARSMWTRRISRFVVLARVDDSVLAAGSVTFESGAPCTPSAPVTLDECGAGKSWGKLERIRAPAINGCILRVVYFEEPPYVMTVNGSDRLTGFEGGLTESLTRGRNVDRVRVEWKNDTTYAEQTAMLLYEEPVADLVIGRILQQSHEDIGYSTTYDMLKVVWVIPKVANVSLKGLVQPFHPYVWAAIGATLLLAGLVGILANDQLSWLDTFALIIGVAIPRQPFRLSGKIRCISWTIFGMFLCQVYVDSLADQLINVSDAKIETAAELMSSSFEIGGTAAFAGIFDDFRQTDDAFSSILERFVVFDQDDYAKQFDDLLDGRNASFALVAVLNSSRTAAIETAYAYAMTAEAICSFPLALATWKGFPYLRYIDEKIHDYIDAGIFDFMVRLAIANETRRMLFQTAQVEEYKSNLHLQQFVPAFLLIVIGFASGLISLILEIALHPAKFPRQSSTRRSTSNFYRAPVRGSNDQSIVLL